MKWLKGLLAIVLGLPLLILFIALFALFLENKSTSYLKIKDHPEWENQSWCIRHVNIIPMNQDTVLLDQDLIIEDGIITAIGSNLEAKNLKVIDGGGAYLSPGLIDMHMHLWDRHELGLYLANGVTSVRSLLGMPFHLQVKDEIEAAEILGPDFYTSSPQLSGPEDGDPLKKPVSSPEETRALIQDYQNQGYDFIKTYNLLEKDCFDAAIAECEKLKIPLIAHPSFKVDYEYHMQPGISSVEHTEDIFQQALDYQYDREKLDLVIADYAQSQQAHCPTLTVFFNLSEIYRLQEDFLKREQNHYINPFIEFAAGDYERHIAHLEADSSAGDRIWKQHQFHLKIVKKLHEAGAFIICGTDAGIVGTAAGYSIHHELEFYRQCGMTNYEALRTATWNPSKVHPQFKDCGSIAIGMKANFILSSQNPLEQISSLEKPIWVMQKGRKLEAKSLSEFEAKAHDRSNFIATAVRVLKYMFWDK
ncbi:amidohydrolase family protein [Croceimicrobium hydrocarbonivorans]|uniref:Amidohydrolase family protein n=1 Tax=Croceimicrobium hydrocarbonivorans TaxID=2761580 RepID=A0A7H0VIG2_9FLAO|nr:amidohydrolase family protein [Croceimicrobium hydrocarbonivorans]QNR25510.1 amidohydrolase family protein [Croceimicrobium hydrocarbonivorans]